MIFIVGIKKIDNTKTNLSSANNKGIDELSKMKNVKVVQTDKSKKLAVIAEEVYLRMMAKHLKDEPISEEKKKESYQYRIGL